MKYKYKIIERALDSLPSEAMFTHLGIDGWKLITVVHLARQVESSAIHEVVEESLVYYFIKEEAN